MLHLRYFFVGLVFPTKFDFLFRIKNLFYIPHFSYYVVLVDFLVHLKRIITLLMTYEYIQLFLTEIEVTKLWIVNN